ncbi:MAG: hydroxylamine reductase, partial [Bacteroidales bacterium]
MENMFCFQCQEAAKGVGCTIKGVCGKDDELANRMDLLMFVVKGISVIATELGKHDLNKGEADVFVTDALFSTITNANFDLAAINARILKGLELKSRLLKVAKDHKVTLPELDAVTWSAGEEKFEAVSKIVGVLSEPNEDLRSLKELVVYGVKGFAAYVDHAANLGVKETELFRFMQYALSEVARKDISADELIALVLKTGEYGVKGMALLD